MSTFTAASSGKVGTPSGRSPLIVSKTTSQEFSIRVPKNCKKRYHVMRFNGTTGVDFAKWKSQSLQIKMERENNLKEFKGTDEEIPKFGAGSEFGREPKEEARRKKYGIITKKYKIDDQPWLLKAGGKTGKKYRGVREGGVSDNSAYYVFTQAGNGVIEAYPLQEWYNFQPVQKYKALTAEEAEEEFGRRHKLLNYFSLMSLKRARIETDDVEDPDEGKTKKVGSKKKNKKEKKDLKISDMDDYAGSTDEMSLSDDEEKKSGGSDSDSGKKKKKKGGGAKKKKKKKDSDDEAIEESDDGDEEGRELDYISDSSESASDHEMKANKELKGVAEEDALRKLLNSESDTEDEENAKKDENESNSEENEEKKEEKEKSKEDTGSTGAGGSKKKKKKQLTKKKKNRSDDLKKLTSNEEDGSSSELSPNSTDTDSDSNNGANKKKTGNTASQHNKDSANSTASSRSATPTPVTGEKRKATPSELAIAAAKKVKLENGSSSLNSYSSSSDVGVTEDAVRRYLMRKPMTTTELLQKFKSKKTGLSSEQLVNSMTQILKNINPIKQTIKNKMYLSIKPC